MKWSLETKLLETFPTHQQQLCAFCIPLILYDYILNYIIRICAHYSTIDWFFLALFEDSGRKLRHVVHLYVQSMDSTDKMFVLGWNLWEEQV